MLSILCTKDILFTKDLKKIFSFETYIEEELIATCAYPFFNS